MQVGVMKSFLLLVKRCLPAVIYRVALEHDVFDRVFVDRHPFLTAIILEASKPVATAPEIIEVASLYIANEFIIGRESPVRRHQEKMRLDAFEVSDRKSTRLNSSH